MYKRILVAVDGSDIAETALQEATKLAKEQQAILRIVHAVDVVNINYNFNLEADIIYPAEISDAMIQRGQEILRRSQTMAHDAGVAAETSLIEIDRLGLRIPEAIANEAQAWQADLLVIGTHGRRGLSHLFLGSVAEGVVRVATKPVLLIRGH